MERLGTHLGALIQRRSALVATSLLLLSAQAFAEKRIIVGGLDNDSHFSYRFKGEDPLFDVKVTRPKLPKTVKITNDTGRNIKVHFFNASDNVRAVPKHSKTLKDGKSVSWPFQLYHIKVYEPKLLDKHVLTKLDINSDVTIKKKGGDYSASVAKAPDFSVTNNSSESIVAYIYNEGDNVRLIARKSLTVAPKTTITWKEPTIDEFQVRIHRAKFLGAVISESRNANVRTSIVVEELEWSPWKNLLQRDSKTNSKVFPGTDGLSVSANGSAVGGGVWWPQIFGLSPANGLWIQTLIDSPEADAINSVNNSTDWELVDWDGDLKTHSRGQIASTPSVVGDGDSGKAGGDKVLFARGPNGNLITKRLYDSGGSDFNSGGWTDLGANLDSRPTAVGIDETGKKRLLVAVRDAATNSLHTRFREKDGKWGAWNDHGGNLMGSPAACTGVFGKGSATGLARRVDVFARGSDNTLRHRAWLEGEGWQVWKNLGGNLASDPAVYSESDKNPWPNDRTAKTRYHVVALDPAGSVVYRYFNGSNWSDWKSLGGKFVSAPVVFLSDDEK